MGAVKRLARGKRRLAGSGGRRFGAALRDGITFRLRGVTWPEPEPEPKPVSGTVEYAVPDTDGGLPRTRLRTIPA